MSADPPTRRELIIVLLDNYVDVEAQGLRDRRGEGEHIPLMSRAWNHPSYVQLDNLLGDMKGESWPLYRALALTYFHSDRRMVKQCARCHGEMPIWHSTNFHRHGRSNVAVLPKVVRVVHSSVSAEAVERAIYWLEERWAGSVFLPDELRAVA